MKNAQTKLKIILVVIFLFIAIVHLVLEFTAWTYAPGNTAFINHKTEGLRKGMWLVSSFPLIWLIPSNWDYFWSIFILNSLIWSTFWTGIVYRIIKHRYQ